MYRWLYLLFIEQSDSFNYFEMILNPERCLGSISTNPFQVFYIEIIYLFNGIFHLGDAMGYKSPKFSYATRSLGKM